MEEARRVLDRLDRIESLQLGAAPAQVLLDEVRSLLVEAEAWVRTEAAGAGPAAAALDQARKAFARPAGTPAAPEGARLGRRPEEAAPA